MFDKKYFLASLLGALVQVVTLQASHYYEIEQDTHDGKSTFSVTCYGSAQTEFKDFFEKPHIKEIANVLLPTLRFEDTKDKFKVSATDGGATFLKLFLGVPRIFNTKIKGVILRPGEFTLNNNITLDTFLKKGFSGNFYAMHNPDVKMVAPELDDAHKVAIIHYLNFGHIEKRVHHYTDLDDQFDPQSYLELNPDVAQVARSFRDPLSFAVDHRYLIASDEQRSFIPRTFSSDYYLRNNEDVKNAAGTTPSSTQFAREHYLRYGRNEPGRVCVPQPTDVLFSDLNPLAYYHPVVPSREIKYVCGHDDYDAFLKTGMDVSLTFNLACKKYAGKQLSEYESILDFGCGVGRIIRFLKDKCKSVSGCDVNNRVIEYCNKNFPEIDAYQSSLLPPLMYEDGTFDLVYAFSVFSHLPEEVEVSWLNELLRVGKPGCLYLITVHGDWFIETTLPFDIQQKLRERGFAFKPVHGRDGSVYDFPKYYESSYHTSDYIRAEWSKYFDIIDVVKGDSPERLLSSGYTFKPEGTISKPTPLGQDLVVARKRL
ncbi:MAG: class I SAM-dependent methyltransferase [Alphaproteobacteria bacterium]|nr:class I SAM-dependent methyltransferase [Alphaproteobacteria bacterium]